MKYEVLTEKIFTEAEVDYLTEQRYGRFATVGADGSAHVVPVGLTFNKALQTIDVTGRNMEKSRKYRDAALHEQVAFVVDDVPSLEPEIVRGIEIRGVAEVLSHGGKDIYPHVSDEMIRIWPTRIISWGINAELSAGFDARTVKRKGKS